MKKWYSKEAEEQYKKYYIERCEFDKQLEIQRLDGSYTGPVGPTIGEPKEVVEKLRRAIFIKQAKSQIQTN